MALPQLIWRENSRRPLSLLLLFGLTLVGSMLVALGGGLAEHLQMRLAERLRSDDGDGLAIDVHARRPEQALAGISFERKVLTDDDVRWLRGLPGVEQAMVLHAVPIPATVFVRVPGLLDNNQYLAIYGMEAIDLPGTDQEAWAAARIDGAIPILMNPDVITYYNLGMADRYGLPRLDREILMDREFGLLVGADVFRSMPNNFRVRIVVRGFHGVVNPWGIVLPKQVTDACLARIYGDRVPREAAPVQVRLLLDSADRIDAIQALVEERGLVLADREPLAATVSGIAGLGRQVMAGIGLVLLVTVGVACAALAAGLISERRRQIALYRLAGATPLHLAIIFAGGICLVLVVASLAGLMLANGVLPGILAPLVEALQLPPLADAAGLPHHYWLIAPLAALACGLVATMPPLVVLHRRPLLQLVREG